MFLVCDDPRIVHFTRKISIVYIYYEFHHLLINQTYIIQYVLYCVIVYFEEAA